MKPFTGDVKRLGPSNITCYWFPELANYAVLCTWMLIRNHRVRYNIIWNIQIVYIYIIYYIYITLYYIYIIYIILYYIYIYIYILYILYILYIIYIYIHGISWLAGPLCCYPIRSQPWRSSQEAHSCRGKAWCSAEHLGDQKMLGGYIDYTSIRIGSMYGIYICYTIHGSYGIRRFFLKTSAILSIFAVKNIHPSIDKKHLSLG